MRQCQNDFTCEQGNSYSMTQNSSEIAHRGMTWPFHAPKQNAIFRNAPFYFVSRASCRENICTFHCQVGPQPFLPEFRAGNAHRPELCISAYAWSSAAATAQSRRHESDRASDGRLLPNRPHALPPAPRLRPRSTHPEPLETKVNAHCWMSVFHS